MAAATDGQTAVIDEVVADKGHPSNQVLVDLAALDLRMSICSRFGCAPRAVTWRPAHFAARQTIPGVRRSGFVGWEGRFGVPATRSLETLEDD